LQERGARMVRAGRRRWQGASFLAGMLIGVAIVTPVFAATGEAFEPWHAMLLVASLVLLVAGLAIAAHASAPRTMRPGQRVTSNRSRRPVSIASRELGCTRPVLLHTVSHWRHFRY